jgi:truncated hemoglobin YjbI
MEGSDNLHRLVSGLSLDERQNLLDKLKGQSRLADEQLYFENKNVPAKDIATVYSKLPWFTRLWYYILSIFKSKSPIKIFEDNQVSVLGNKIEENSPGLYNYQSGMLLPVFYRQMTRLKEAAKFFYTALDISVNRDRGAFFSFLGSLEMADVHKRLQEETDPNNIMEKHSEITETELRQIAAKAMDDALAMINEKQRNAMYFDARSLFCLKQLSSFLFDRVLLAFSTSAAANGETCSVGVVRELLVSLNNILLSLKFVPPMALLESLFIFILQEKAGEPGFDIDREIRGLLTKAETSMAVIRDFNRQVPITLILRCYTRDMSLSPMETSGGEDWFIVYRDYWKRRIDSLFGDYIKERRQRELLDSSRSFLKGKNLEFLANTQTASNPDGLPIKGAFALSFLCGFYSELFIRDINLILQPILIDGEFKNAENRLEFNEGYNNIIKLEDEIKKLGLDISESGEYGKRYAQARQEMSAIPVKRRKIQNILDEAEEDAENIINSAKQASLTMVNTLSGIIGKEVRGKYDTLINLPKIAGQDKGFLEGIGEAIQQFQTVLKLLNDMEAMENVR